MPRPIDFWVSRSIILDMKTTRIAADKLSNKTLIAISAVDSRANELVCELVYGVFASFRKLDEVDCGKAYARAEKLGWTADDFDAATDIAVEAEELECNGEVFYGWA